MIGVARELSVEVLHDVGASAVEWDELVTEAGAAPFMRPGWIGAWSAAFGAGDLRLVTVRRDHELVGALPMLQTRGHLRAPANWHTPLFEPIAVDDEACTALLGALFDAPQASVELNLLNGSSAACADAARAAGRHLLARPIARCPYVDIRGSFAEYEQGLSRKRRKELRRQQRRLEAIDTLTVELHEDEAALDHLEEAFAVEASGWKGQSGTAITSCEHTRRFYTDVARWAADNGWLRICLLRLGGEAIASDYAIAHDGVWYAVKGGYEERYRSYGPGAILLRAQIEHCFEHDMARLDLLGQPDPFKLSWTTHTAERFWMQAFRNTPAGLAGWSRRAARERARPVAARALARR